MPGTYGRQWFLTGDKIKLKPVRSGPCVECGAESYRETFIPRSGWIWRCYSCDPYKPFLERRLNAKHNPQGYVPVQYDRIAKAERTNAQLKAGNLVARPGPGKAPKEDFRVRVH